jgi:1-deoxy-D-xylulose-5-phosphate reductoisomerase
MIRITVLGSTGSIGTSTLDVIRLHPDRFQIFALAANSSIDLLFDQILEFKPEYAVMVNSDSAVELRQRLASTDLKTEVLDGEAALDTVAGHADVDAVMAAIVGAAGLKSAYAAACAGKRVLLANKESLVVAGQLFMDAVETNNAILLPVDSEHNAVFQCLPTDSRQGVKRILLTASGGPFRRHSRDQLTDITPEQACAHPNWSMGPKISVDSATMMNKGLEVIEAHWLFGAQPEDIQVVVHPQSIIHSMVEYVDGSVLAQMGNPDMRTPIAYALDWPNRIASGVGSLDLFAVARLDFEAPDFERFPCLELAYQAIRSGQTAPAILNAANEIGVQAFLDCRIPFLAIPELIQRTLESVSIEEPENITHLLDVDCRARSLAERIITELV